jgi:exosortase/archaeosortase family protein
MAYFGTIAVEGLATPEHYYSPFIQHYADYPSWLRASLLSGARLLLSLFGYSSYVADHYHINMTGGKGVQLIYACLGVGVTCFWLAFVVANKGGWAKKLIWVIGGSLCIWVINVARISLFLIAINKQQQMPFGVDNHTFFDVLAYVAIFVLMFFYDRSFRKDNKV